MSDVEVAALETTAEQEVPVVEKKQEEETISVTAQEALFMEDCVKVVLSDGYEKLVSYKAFIDILRGLTNRLERSSIDGFCLPSGTFYFAKSADTIQISCYYSSGVRNLKYYDSKMDVLTPNIIISHTLTKDRENKSWKMTDSRYFCTDVSVGNLPKTFIHGVNTNERVYLLPMTNTYSEANMCYGGNQMPQKFADNNLRALDWYYRFLWESPFNDDLGVRAINDSMSPREWYALLKKCATDKEAFPYKKLRGWTAR